MACCVRVFCCKPVSNKVEAAMDDRAGDEIFVGVRSNACNLKVTTGRISDSTTSQMTSEDCLDDGSKKISDGCHKISSLQVRV